MWKCNYQDKEVGVKVLRVYSRDKLEQIKTVS